MSELRTTSWNTSAIALARGIYASDCLTEFSLNFEHADACSPACYAYSPFSSRHMIFAFPFLHCGSTALWLLGGQEFSITSFARSQGIVTVSTRSTIHGQIRSLCQTLLGRDPLLTF